MLRLKLPKFISSLNALLSSDPLFFYIMTYLNFFGPYLFGPVLINLKAVKQKEGFL